MFNSIWNSFRRTPLWVQVWVALILMPINFLALCFLNEPLGYWVAFLAVIGMLLNIPILLIDRGLSKLMSVPHVIIWTPLCVLVAWLLTSLFSGRHDLSLSYTIFLIALLIINGVSLFWDWQDAVKWFRGDRAIA